MRRKSRGVALVMALLLVLLLGIIARAIIAVGPGHLAAVSQGEDLREARRAAEAGLAYATARIKENPGWRGNGNGRVVDTPDLIVDEDNGNVFGLLRDPQGNLSTFRLRFNYQDGAGGADALNDPSPAHFIDSIYVSFNNSEGTGAAQVPRADPTTYAVPASPTMAYSLPAKAFSLSVEGRSGPGLRDLTDPAQVPTHGRVVRQTVETVYQYTLGQVAEDAPVMGGGNLTFELPSGSVDPGDRGGRPPRGDLGGGWRPDTPLVSVTSRNGLAKPRLRSKKGVKVTQGTNPGPLRMQGGEVGREAASGLSASLSGQVTQVDESVGDGKDFYNLKWSDITTADADPDTRKAVHLPGGTYVHWQDGSLHYYDMSFADYQTMMADPAKRDDPGTLLQSQNLQELRTPTNLAGALANGLRVNGMEWTFRKDLCVLPSVNGTKDFAILPQGGRKLSPTDSSTVVAGPGNGGRPDLNVTNATISFPGNAILIGTLEGEDATFTAEGNMTVVSREVQVRVNNGNAGGSGGSVGTGGNGGTAGTEGTGGTGGTGTVGEGAEVAKVQGLNFYVKHDLTISSYQLNNTFEDIFIDGLIYCWGNFRGLAGGEGSPRWGEFDIDGALVAYGGDPETGRPGSDGSGQIHIAGGFIDLAWDGNNLASIVQVERVPTTLRRTLYTCH